MIQAEASVNPAGRYSLLLPEVITGRLRRPDTLLVATVPDARVLLGRYFAAPHEVWAFESALRQPDNLACPDRITFANWAAARALGVHLEWEAAQPLTEAVQPLLKAIPPDADLFRDWSTYEAPALQLLTELAESHGLRVGEATALLYQKRPLLFPIFDRETRQAFNIPARSGSRRETFRLALSRFLAVATIPANEAALDHTLQWLAGRPTATRLLTLSRVRVLNLVAAAAAQEVDPRSDREAQGGSREEELGE